MLRYARNDGIWFLSQALGLGLRLRILRALGRALTLHQRLQIHRHGLRILVIQVLRAVQNHLGHRPGGKAASAYAGL